MKGLLLKDVNFGSWDGSRWHTLHGDWTIVAPWEKLMTKYSLGTTLLFDVYAFLHGGINPDRISDTDIEAAHRLMGANIFTKRRHAITASNDSLVRVLSKIPRDAAIDSDSHDQAVADAIGVLTGPGVGLAIATKLLTLKRPHLIPMMDSVVQNCFESSDPMSIMAGFRSLLSNRQTRTAIDGLILRLEKECRITISPIRVLDQLIWFDWNLPKKSVDGVFPARFAGWQYDPKKPELGVYLASAD